MSSASESGRRRIDAAAKTAFLGGVKQGLALEQAAQGAGFTLDGFRGARRRDAVFAADWSDSLELAGYRARGPLHHETGVDVPRTSAALSGGQGDLLISDGPPPRSGEDCFVVAPNNKRRLQRREMPHARFTPARKQRFLDLFAGTCDIVAAAAACGIDRSTAYRHRRTDAAFAAGWDAALDEGYRLLETEAVRQRLAAQELLRTGALPAGEAAQEFERTLKLLARYERRSGRIGQREIAAARRPSVSFDEAIEALARRLRTLDIPLAQLSPPEAGKP